MVPKRISITFQGGFVGTRCSVEVPSKNAEGGKVEWEPWTSIYPEDVNRMQTFELSNEERVKDGIQRLRLVFQESSDFFGRITVYDLQLYGNVV